MVVTDNSEDQQTDETRDSEERAADEKILATALERFQFLMHAEEEIRKLAIEDMNFAAGEQWDEQMRKSREQDGRPCLTVNRQPQFIHQVANDQRQNRPQINVSPVDDFADLETAKIRQGIIRHIERNSNADTAYSTAFESALRSGFGYWRVITEYADPMSFSQQIRIMRIANNLSAGLDPHFKELDGSDANWGFTFQDISLDDFKDQYPDADLSASDANWKDISKSSNGWVSEKSCRIAEYFYKDFKKTKIILMQNGDIVEQSKFVEGMIPAMRDGKPIERETRIPIVRWCKMVGNQILEKTEWPGQWIPIVIVVGGEVNIDGKRIWESLHRHAKDSQKMLNFWVSAETETIALAPRAPWIGFAGQFEGFERQWETANRKNHAYLEVNPVDVNGTPVFQLPQRNAFEPNVQAITNARMLAADDLKATIGIYDAALGAKSNEQSGVAIQKRNVQAQIANFHFMDNLAKSIRHTGRIINDLLDHVMDVPQAVRILGPEGDEEVIRINEEFEHNGEMKTYQMGKGKYDVSVSTGPGFETKRQEAVSAMLEFIRVYPAAAQMIGDLMVKHMDWPGAQEISERLKKMLPPGVSDDKKKGDAEVPAEVQAQMAEMNQMIEQLTAALNQANEKVDRKTLELESKERIEYQKLQVQMLIEEMKLQSMDSRTAFQAELSQIERRLDLLNQNKPIQESEMNGVGLEQAVALDEQQPTDGLTSGTPMGEAP
jgi:hypothetical protein